MSIPDEPETASASAVLPTPQRLPRWLHKVIVALADGAMIRRRDGGGEAATPYEAIQRLTFGVALAGKLAGFSRADARKLAPVLFSEAFEDPPTEATRNSVALSILGPAGMVLMVAMIIAAGICIDIELLQSADRSKAAPNMPATTKPAGPPPSPPAPPSKGITLPDLDPLSKLRSNSLNQAAPRPPQSSDKLSPVDAQPQQEKQLDPGKQAR